MSDFAELRRQMVETQLRTRDVTDRALLLAMLDVPRERFVPEGRAGLAYSDMRHNLDGAHARVLPAPEAFARLIQLGEIGADDVVLDIACGTGYSSAVLSHIASAVVALEDDPDLAAQADAVLTALEVGNAAVLSGDLAAGVPSEAPFDVIVIEGAVGEVPESLLKQLKEGGRLVTGIAHGRTVVATLFVKMDGVVTRHEAFDIALSPIAAFAVPEVFSF
ncbi:MAG: protein-L-isoaspartate O-methyltransferase [Novosphingobium sp.]